MASPVSPSLQNILHDKAYYIHSGDLVFLVENVLFRVHRYFFERESVYFQTLFETPCPETEPRPGSSDSSAIMLDTTASQFSRFVWVFYNPKLSLYDEASLADWKSILELSHRWFFPQVKQLAIRELQKQELSHVQRIELYHKNGVDRAFLVPSYLALCQRPAPLTLHEGLDLGLETTLMIARTREEIRTPRSPEGVMTPLTPTLQGPELVGLIGKLFVDGAGGTEDEEEGGDVKGLVNGTAAAAAGAISRPTIVINGAPQPKAEKNGISGGLGNKQQTEQVPSPGLKPKKKKKILPENQAQQGESTGPKTASSQTAETRMAETRKAAAAGEEAGSSENQTVVKKPESPGAGQQGAGGGGGANSEKEKENDSAKGGGGNTEAGPKAGGTGDTQGVLGTGDPLAQTGGETDTIKDKTQQTSTVGTNPDALANGEQDHGNSANPNGSS